jgi:hypothetical protein
MNLKHDLHAIAPHFQIEGKYLSAAPYGNGHINDTYCVAFEQGTTNVNYIFQRINHCVFKNPVALMQNIQRVTSHLGNKIKHDRDNTRRALTLIPSHDGQPFHCDEQGNYWRAYIFIERARTFDTVESPRQAFEATKAFGNFQALLADLPAPRLHDTIPDFHHTAKRFVTLEKAIEADVANRAQFAKPEIDFVLRRKNICSLLLDAGLPERLTHNDTKLNNVMLDETTGEGICVIDLDTVMPGLALYDFGDMVRTMTSPAKEDEKDLLKVTMQFPMFESIIRGYLASASGFLTKQEKQLLPASGKIITFEAGIRFLADFLVGDVYFKVHRDGHNLDRCRTQFKLVESIERQEDKMNKLVQVI